MNDAFYFPGLQGWDRMANTEVVSIVYANRKMLQLLIDGLDLPSKLEFGPFAPAVILLESQFIPDDFFVIQTNKGGIKFFQITEEE